MKKYFLLLALCCLAMQAQQKTAYAYFGFNSDVLTAEARNTLDSISSEIKGTENYSIKIYGFTDDAGTDAYNNMLAQKRADTVAAYFQLLGFAVAEAAPDSPQLRQASLSAEKKRRVRIVYSYTTPNIAVASQSAGGGGGANVPAITGVEGTNIVLSGGIGPGEVAVSEYFNTESMIAGGMYGIAEGGDILKTDGMIQICNSYKTIDSTGMYTIVIPATLGPINKKASVWLAVKDDAGKTVWKNTPIEVVTDDIKKTYTIKMRAQPDECTHINLDMLANRANGYRVVYLYTDKPYDFSKVHMYNSQQDMLFSAKVNDTTWAFCVPNNAGLAGIKFKGTQKYGRKEIGIQLRKCRHKVDKKRDHHYYITEKALIAGLPKTIPFTPKKKESWFKKLF